MIWIDALCIDQISTHEKNRLVAAMGHTFSAANRVVIWLGPEESRSNTALDVIEHIGRQVDVGWSTESLRPSEGCLEEEMHWIHTEETLSYRNGELTPV